MDIYYPNPEANYITALPFYPDAVVCAHCGEHLNFGHDGYWTNDQESTTCKATPLWENTRLVGWDFTPHSPVVAELK